MSGRSEILLSAVLFSVMAAAVSPAVTTDTRPAQHLDRAKYLPVRLVRPGMRGYGITALPGSPRAKFEVEVISVLKNFVGPGQDAILVKCKGADLENTGILAGMSGSPIWLPDPEDNNKPKLAGAVAYGWPFNKEPLCGVQPIEQMLALQRTAATQAATPAGIATEQIRRQIFSGWRAKAAGLNEILGFAALPGPMRQTSMHDGHRSSGPASAFAAAGSDLATPGPLTVPLSVSGWPIAKMGLLQQTLAGTGFSAVPAPAYAESLPAENDEPLRPGDPLAVILLSGDLDISASGTVTEVTGEEVYAFGHSLFSSGRVEMPLACGRVVGRIASLYKSFKIVETGRQIGTLVTDGSTAIVGKLGRPAKTIPIRIETVWPDGSYDYHFQAGRHPMFTPISLLWAVQAALSAWHDLPMRNTVRYEITVKFERLGGYRIADIASAADGYASAVTVLSDLVAPVGTMLSGPGGPIYPDAVDITIKVEPTLRLARISDVVLLNEKVKPGGTVRLKVSFVDYDGRISTAMYETRVPDTARPGKYILTVCSAQQHLMRLRREQPERFRPRTARQMLDLLNTIASVRSDRLYIRLVRMDRSGVSIGGFGLPDLPEFWQEILTAGSEGYSNFVQASVSEHQLEFVLTGSVDLEITVDRNAP